MRHWTWWSQLLGLSGTNGNKHLLLWNRWAKFLDIVQEYCPSSALLMLYKCFRLDEYSPSYAALNLVISATWPIWAWWLQTSSSLKPLGQILRYRTGMLSRKCPSNVVQMVPVEWFLRQVMGHWTWWSQLFGLFRLNGYKHLLLWKR